MTAKNRECRAGEDRHGEVRWGLTAGRDGGAAESCGPGSPEACRGFAAPYRVRVAGKPSDPSDGGVRDRRIRAGTSPVRPSLPDERDHVGSRAGSGQERRESSHQEPDRRDRTLLPAREARMAAPAQKAPASDARLRRGCDPAERRHSAGVRHGLPAGPPAGGGRTRAGRRAGRPTACCRPVQALP